MARKVAAAYSRFGFAFALRLESCAQALAKGAPPNIALSHMKIADEWEKLAEEIERSN